MDHPVQHAFVSAVGQAWPPFVLVVGLLLIGAVVEADGLFVALGTRIERIGGGPITLLATLLGLVAVVTAVLNLDTAVVFLTPIVIHAARQRHCDERPFLYGTLFMANGASLLLPGSNLTNLIVLAHEDLSGAEFAHRMLLRGSRSWRSRSSTSPPSFGCGTRTAAPNPCRRCGSASALPRRPSRHC